MKYTIIALHISKQFLARATKLYTVGLLMYFLRSFGISRVCKISW